jgi:hypothetical protein
MHALAYTDDAEISTTLMDQHHMSKIVTELRRRQVLIGLYHHHPCQATIANMLCQVQRYQSKQMTAAC